MGGGDLNLKKSWHPSTMKNMEKVWKAEQQNDQEKKRIAELKREIEMEKDREDMTRYAMGQGVIEKKDEKKLDWMYKGPNQMVNREEYLLGRPVDKAFEQMAQAEKDIELNRPPKNHVEHECIPPSLRFFSGNEQVDLIRKVQEDPLYAIKKKEIETRNQLLKNPVRLKQLKQLLEQQSYKNKGEKKKKKMKRKDSSDDEAKLDMLLAVKYKQLKDDISEQDLLKSMRKKKYKRKKSKKRIYDVVESDSNYSNDVSIKRSKRQKKRKKSTSISNNDSDKNSNSDKNDTQSERRDNREERIKKRCNDDTKAICSKREIMERRSSRERGTRHSKDYNMDCKRRQEDNYRERDDSKNKYNDESKYSAERRNDIMISNDRKSSGIKSSFVSDRTKFTEDKRGEKERSKLKPRLTEEEKEQRRQEMMANAVWRDKEREKNVNLYREEEKKEAQNDKSYNKDFIRKQLVIAAEVGTVESRIRANINNIQRFDRAMNTNFAKR